MDKINFANVCRTCISEKDEMLNICNSVNCNGNLLTIIKVLNSFTTKEVVENDNLPSLICNNCVELALNAYNFKVQCDRSQSLLEEYYTNLLLKVESDVKENIKAESDVNENIDNNFNNNLQVAYATIAEANETFQNTANSSGTEAHTDVLAHGSHPKVKRKYTKCSSKIKNPTRRKTSSKLLTQDRPVSEGKKNQRTSEIEEIENQLSKDLGLLFFCSQCNKSFKNKYIFSAHEKRHEFKGQFLCNVCGKGFSSQSCLNRHNRVHTGEKKYECIECHKRFPSSYNLNLHSRIHSGHKPYLCTVCGKRFSHPTGLTYHMRTHTQEKPYSCELCGKRFAIQCHFDRHKKTHSGERPFACSQCGRAFIKKIDLQRHEEIHTGLKPHSCTICKKSFLRLKTLNYHMMLHTEERPHICPDCGKGFIRSYYLRDHIRKHHK